MTTSSSAPSALPIPLLEMSIENIVTVLVENVSKMLSPLPRHRHSFLASTLLGVFTVVVLVIFGMLPILRLVFQSIFVQFLMIMLVQLCFFASTSESLESRLAQSNWAGHGYGCLQVGIDGFIRGLQARKDIGEVVTVPHGVWAYAMTY